MAFINVFGHHLTSASDTSSSTRINGIQGIETILEIDSWIVKIQRCGCGCNSETKISGTNSKMHEDEGKGSAKEKNEDCLQYFERPIRMKNPCTSRLETDGLPEEALERGTPLLANLRHQMTVKIWIEEKVGISIIKKILT